MRDFLQLQIKPAQIKANAIEEAMNSLQQFEPELIQEEEKCLPDKKSQPSPVAENAKYN